MSHKVISGELRGDKQKLAIVLGRFNSFIGDALLSGAIDVLSRHSVKESNITCLLYTSPSPRDRG